MKEITAPTIEYKIFIAGDIDVAKRICREYCYRIGLCVTVSKTTFIYTGGEEAGICVGLINYPRFPDAAEGIAEKTMGLANLLCENLAQHSFSIVGPKETIYKTRRE